MSKAPIRTAQLVSPFGPGALYTDANGHVLLVAGLDQWFHRRNQHSGELELAEKIEEFIIHEPRLSNLLGGTGFRRAPDYRAPRSGEEVPVNALITVPAVRFPTWYRNKRGNGLKKVPYQQAGRVGGQREQWVPVRFATACEHGHLNEFPWKEWAQCTCGNNEGLRLDDRGGTGLESIKVHCANCPEGSPGRVGRTLQGLTHLPEDENQPSALGNAQLVCSGGRPWLGDNHVVCGSNRMVAVLLSQSNLYSAQTASSLKLPDPEVLTDDVTTIINFLREPERWLLLQRITQRWQSGRTATAEDNVRDALADAQKAGADAQAITTALQVCCGGRAANTENSPVPQDAENEDVAFRRVEYGLLQKATPADLDVCLRVVASEVPVALKPYIAQVNRIEELTEVRALCGFSRLVETSVYPLSGVAEAAATQFFRTPPVDPTQRWLPAIQVSGEGLFVQFDEGQVRHWLAAREEQLKGRLSNNFIARMASERRLMPPLAAADWRWGARFLLVHSFSHILINQLVFECGYSTAALRERLYVSPDPVAPMMATLIYTAQGDSEGTMGGLVNLGHADRFEAVVRRALSKASWCSADPVCSESHGAGGAKRVNLAACHSCALLPETACETINDGIDRGVVIGSADDKSFGFFSPLVFGP